MTLRRRRRLLAGGIVIGVAAAIAVAGILWWTTRPSGPEDAARAWLDALADGDAPRAVAVMADDTAASLGEALVGADALLADPAIEEVIADGEDAAEAVVTFSLAGETQQARLPLVRTTSEWRVAGDALGVMSVATTLGDSVTVGGVPVAAGELRLLPAVYPVAAAPADLLDGSATAIVLPGAMTGVELDPVLSPAAVDAAAAELDAYLAECTQPATAVPENCGLRVPWPADLQSLDGLSYRVEQSPALALADDGRTFVATEGVVVATATGVGRDGMPARVTYRDDAWAVRGTVAVVGDELRLAVL